MERFEGRCSLDWWANPSTLLARVDIAVVIADSGGGWDARGRLIHDDDEGRQGLAFLCGLDPVFTLSFEDGSSVPVTVHALDDQGRFVLAEHTDPAVRRLP
ncbi:hypothetical protein ACFFMM_20865 [Micromonospora chaiyaphumensis]|uniref:Uncharacterized protein n=1 Tax=Micromonospora chaiyaphumensis TaxID=307119 RepID=A0A1C4TWZ6_9ACTN|nr:hypothetical protein [Micromonospora chaiyaphumensis]SCE63961.1 hypothetical protein GA0070214_10174 [Micromonospora chaiyaphumensis]